jgi:hypothetical protein
VHDRALVLAAALLAAGSAGAAESPPPLTVPDLVGPRTLGLGAGIGNASGNEALFLNPAAIAARKRYTVDAFYLTDRRPGLTGAARQQDYFGSAVADSISTPVAAGFAYVRSAKGLETGTLLRVDLAGPLANGLFLGLQGNYFDLSGATRVASALNLDAGLFYQAADYFSVGASGYNLLSSKHRDVSPRGYSAGIALGSETSVQLVADWHLDLDRGTNASGGKKNTNRYSAGAEYLVSGAVPLRAGFEVDDTSKTKWWSLGIGLTSTKAALDLGYRQSTTDPRAKTIGVAIRVFVPNE